MDLLFDRSQTDLKGYQISRYSFFPWRRFLLLNKIPKRPSAFAPIFLVSLNLVESK